jgi:hypothetical protein
MTRAETTGETATVRPEAVVKSLLVKRGLGALVHSKLTVIIELAAANLT